jgi:signal transduction histidine kinase
LPIAPLLVAVIGIATAVLLATIAAEQLQKTSDDAAQKRSAALAGTLAARVRTAPPERRDDLVDRASRATGASFLIVDQRGALIGDPGLSSLGQADVAKLLERAEGATDLVNGRARYAAATVSPPFQHLSVMAFVPAPSPAVGTTRLSNAVAVLTLLLLGVAVAVALIFTRTARDDVAYVRRRIADMARGGSEAGVGRAGKVPLRSLDQVGLLTGALNNLIDRFAEAEEGYRYDLRAAAQLDTERSQFLAGLSHELRTPLNAILGFSHLLESEDDGPLTADAREALAMISSSGEHLKSLIDDILDLSAMETGQLRLSRVAVDVHDLALEVVREVKATAKDRQIRFEIEGERGAYAWADRRRVRQVLTNLISNAVKATPRGVIRVTVDKDGDMVVVHVSDTGHGIEPAVLQTIFEPYKQAGSASARRGGAGLGLAITRRLVLLHGGTVEARSELGKGSTFTVTLPDETHATHVPRDSLVPWSDAPDVLAGERLVQSSREESS